MAVAWFLCPMVLAPPGGMPGRVFGIDYLTADIRANGGEWDGTEILGPGLGQAIVKVRGAPALLDQVEAQVAGIRRIPTSSMNTPLSDLPPAQQNAIRQEILDAGYTLAEVNARFPNFGDATLRQVLKFMATRRLKPRYDEASDQILVDGPAQPCKPIEAVERKVG